MTQPQIPTTAKDLKTYVALLLVSVLLVTTVGVINKEFGTDIQVSQINQEAIALANQLNESIQNVQAQLTSNLDAVFYTLQKPCTYIVGVCNGSSPIYTMQNGTTGALDFWSTNASNVIDTAISSSGLNGTIIVNRGPFYINNTINMGNAVNLEGISGLDAVFFNFPNEGESNFVWTGLNGSSVISFSKAANNTILSGITIDLNGHSNMIGINMASSSENLVENMAVVNGSYIATTYPTYSGIGVLLSTNGDGSASMFNRLDYVKVAGVDIGFKLNGTVAAGQESGDNNFYGCQVQTARVGIDLSCYCDHNWFYGTWIRNANVSIWINDVSNATDQGVYAEYFYGLECECNHAFVAIVQSVQNGMTNYFIAPDFENTTFSLCTEVLYTNTTMPRNLYIEQDSLLHVNWENWGGNIQLETGTAANAVINGQEFLYLPTATVITAGWNLFYFWNAAFTNATKLALVSVAFGGIYTSYAGNLTCCYGLDNSNNNMYQGLIYLESTVGFTTTGSIFFQVTITENTG